MSLNSKMRLMTITKLVLGLLLTVLACFISGIYGIVHDQVSYTVSPEYYTKFKFLQFGIPDYFYDRFGVAIVGWSATWWMGLVIGIPLCLIGLRIPTAKLYFRSVLQAFCLVILSTSVISGVTLLFSYALIPSVFLGDLGVPEAVIDRVAFVRVGFIHTVGYLGGLISLLLGLVYLLRSHAQIRTLQKSKRRLPSRYLPD